MPRVPIYRANAPDSSRRAAEEHVASGRFATHAEIVYNLVCAHPGCTAIELMHAQETSAPLHQWSIRSSLTGLMHAGCVRQGRIRVCRVNDRDMVTWHRSGPFQVTARCDGLPATPKRKLSSVLTAVDLVERSLTERSRAAEALRYIIASIDGGIMPSLAQVKILLAKE